jgi:pimeloyl-ACP methyl ester carboxylesterase
MTSLPVSSEVNFAVNGINFAGQEWGHKGQLPVLALHGWLDNCASFFALAPLLNDVHLVALDMAGHGQSDHRPGQSGYAPWDDISDIFAIADCLGWEDFVLLGHSRGAIIATLAAGTFPQRIKSLLLVEGFLPEPANIKDAPRQLASSILSLQAQTQKPLSVYPTIDLAIKARARGMFPLGLEAAKAITLRGIKANEGGVSWSTDPRLLAPSAIKLTAEQIEAFVEKIIAPIQLILAKNGLPKLYTNYLQEIARFPNVNLNILDGGHHLHMEQEVNQVAELLNKFLLDIDAPLQLG